METLGPFKGIYRDYIGLWGLYRGYRGLYRGYRGYIGIMETKMETTSEGLGFRV